MAWNFVNDRTRRLRGSWRALYGDGGRLSTFLRGATGGGFPFIDLGDISEEGVEVSQAGEMTQEMSSKAGLQVVEEVHYPSSMTSIMLRLREPGMDALTSMLRNREKTTPTAWTAITAQIADEMDFSTTPAVIGRWYQIYEGNVPVRRMTAFASTKAGSNFETNDAVGMIRFTAAINVNLDDMVITAKASNLHERVSDKIKADTGLLMLEFWSPQWNTDGPRFQWVGEVILESEEALSAVLGEHGPHTVMAMATGPVEFIDFAEITPA